VKFSELFKEDDCNCIPRVLNRFTRTILYS